MEAMIVVGLVALHLAVYFGIPMLLATLVALTLIHVGSGRARRPAARRRGHRAGLSAAERAARGLPLPQPGLRTAEAR